MKKLFLVALVLSGCATYRNGACFYKANWDPTYNYIVDQNEKFLFLNSLEDGKLFTADRTRVFDGDQVFPLDCDEAQRRGQRKHSIKQWNFMYGEPDVMHNVFSNE